MAASGPTILAIQAAIALVSSASHLTLLAPNLVLHASLLGVSLAAIELLVALSFITGVLDWLGGLILVGLVGVIGVVFSPADALEQTFWAGIGAAIAIIGRGSPGVSLPRPWIRRPNRVWVQRAQVVLRTATGVSLIVVSLTEKLWNPELGRAFLLDRPELNVFQSMPGMTWFTNDAFVLSAGLAEAAIGAMLISGFAPRLVILAMWLPFNLGIPVLPSQELLGHLPILGIMYLLLVRPSEPLVALPAGVPPVVAVATPVRLGHQLPHRASEVVAPTRPHPRTRQSIEHGERDREPVARR
jgi:hypothetical protein